MATPRKRFRAMLEPLPGDLGWVVVRLPFEPTTAWTRMVRLRVKVEAGGQIFRTSLFPEAGRGGHFVLVNKKMQKAAGVGPGGVIDLAVEPDLDEREATVPPELQSLLAKQKALSRWYTRLSEAHRREIARWIEGVKGPEAKGRRAEQMVERMLLAMEGENFLPPILEVAFHRNPRARDGWDRMTAIQRRGHLMGVFHYQSPEAREKRVGKVVEDCLRLLKAKSS